MARARQVWLGDVGLLAREGLSVAIPEVWLSQVSSARHWLRSSSISCMMLHSGRVLDTCREGTEGDSEQSPSSGRHSWAFMASWSELELSRTTAQVCTQPYFMIPQEKGEKPRAC